MIRLRPGRRRILPALALSLVCIPLVAASSPTVDDVVAALREDDNARAQTLLDELKSQGLGDTYDVRFLQGVLYLRAGKGAEAARVFDEIETSEGPAPTLASGRALSAWAAGRPAEARTRLEHATRLWPEDAGVWANLGDVYRALAAHAYQRVRALRRNAGAEAPSPDVPALSVQSGTPLSSDIPTPPPVLEVVPAEPAGSASPTSTTESAATAEPAAPAQSAATAEAVAPAEPAAPAQSAATAEPAAPAQSAATAEAVAPAEPAAPAQSAATVEAVAPAEPAAPAQSAATAEAVAAADRAGTTEARVDSTAPADPPPSSGPTASSSPPLSPASPPPPPGAEPPLPSASFSLPSPENVSSVPAPPSPETPACFLAGPWPDTPPAEVLDWIQARNARVLSFQSRSAHYRVYLGPFEDRKQAVQKMISLKKDLGIGDVAWVPAGPLRDAISLGVYLKRESVDRRLRALHALGLDPKVQPPRAGSWLLGSTSDLEALLTEWPPTYPDVPLTPERCPPSR